MELNREQIDYVYRTASIISQKWVDSRDLANDVIIKMLNTDTYKGNTFKSWAHSIVKNTLIDQVRQKKKLKVPQVQLTYPTTYKVLELEDTKLQLSSITNGEQLLKFAEGYSYKELAEECGLSIGAIKFRLNKVRKELHEAYEKR